MCLVEFLVLIEFAAFLSHDLRFLGTGVLQDPEGSLHGIRHQALDLILCKAHISIFRMIPVEMNRIEFAAGRTDTASNALIRIYNRCTTGETAAAFRMYLFLGQCAMHIPEGV